MCINLSLISSYSTHHFYLRPFFICGIIAQQITKIKSLQSNFQSFLVRGKARKRRQVLPRRLRFKSIVSYAAFTDTIHSEKLLEEKHKLKENVCNACFVTVAGAGVGGNKVARKTAQVALAVKINISVTDNRKRISLNIKAIFANFD